MRILGISAFYHDSAAVLLEEGRIVAAAQEERFSRVKHDARFPTGAARWCLAQAAGPIDAVAYYEKPLLKFERILSTALAVAPLGFRAFAAAMPDWLHRKLWLRGHIGDALRALGVPEVPVYFTTHHQAHATSAFLASPFERSAILTLDGVGEWACTAIGRGAGAQIELLREQRFPHSLGLLYSAFTDHAGFRVNSGEYKLMGLAPYGTPRLRECILDELLDLRPDGSFQLRLEHFGFLRGQRMTNARFAARFGPRRSPESELTQHHCDLAASIQAVTEEVVLRLARTARELTGERALCLAGGVALNCVANARLRREGVFERIWVQPAAGDAGGALGAALAVHHGRYGAERVTDDRTDAMRGAFLGPLCDDAEIEAALAEAGLRAERLEGAALHERLAGRLDDGAVVGLVQGRAEYGPRALGARSILADARDPAMQRRLNLAIKFRESFRPFAPVVLAERASDYFECGEPSPYMLFTAPVALSLRRPVAEGADWRSRLSAARSTLPAITHVDYSARLQTVDVRENPGLHALLSAFERRTGCAVLVNTSFNVRGEPPVCRAREAIAGFLATDMDVLALESYVIEKATVPAHLRRAPGAGRVFAPD